MADIEKAKKCSKFLLYFCLFLAFGMYTILMHGDRKNFISDKEGPLMASVYSNKTNDSVKRNTSNKSQTPSKSSILHMDCCKNVTIGNTNLRHIEYFWSKFFNKKDFKLEDLMQYPDRHMFTWTNQTMDYRNYSHAIKPVIFNDGVILKIQERLFSKMTLGGSSFKITFIGDTVYNYTCPFTDYHNGWYEACCPLPHPDCGKLEVKWMYRNFTAYKSFKLQPHNTIIWTKKVCVEEGYLKNMPSQNCSTMDFGSGGYWGKKDGLIRWEKEGCLLPLLERKDQTKCLKQLSSISYYGDSHLRYSLFYTLRLEGLLDQKKHSNKMRGSYDIGHEHYTFNGIAETFPDKLKKLMTSKKIYTKKDIFIIDCGSWNVHRYITRNYFQVMPKVLPLLKELVNKPNFKNATFIWLPQPAFTEAPRGTGKHTRWNNFIIPAVSEWTTARVKQFGFHIVDFFEYSHPRANADVCRFHYLCWNFTPKKIFGEVGLALLQGIFNIICKL